MSVPQVRRVAAETAGTAALVAVVVGSGIQASDLSGDGGVRLLADSLATVLGLGMLIALFGPVSGAHFNPVVSLAAWLLGRRQRGGLSRGEFAAYAAGRTAGAIGGAVLANVMFARPLVRWSTHDRFAGIAPTSVVPFVAAQFAGAAIGLGLVAVLFDRPAPAEADVVLPHADGELAAVVDR